MQLVIHMISEANQEETQGKSKPWLAQDLISFATVSHLIFFLLALFWVVGVFFHKSGIKFQQRWNDISSNADAS